MASQGWLTAPLRRDGWRLILEGTGPEAAGGLQGGFRGSRTDRRGRSRARGLQGHTKRKPLEGGYEGGNPTKQSPRFLFGCGDWLAHRTTPTRQMQDIVQIRRIESTPGPELGC